MIPNAPSLVTAVGARSVTLPLHPRSSESTLQYKVPPEPLAMTRSLSKLPSAVLPVLMSLAGIALVLVHWLRFGIVRAADEGTSAHLFQILMVAQLPIIAYFAVNWLPKIPRVAWRILAVQLLAGVAALGSVYWLEHAAVSPPPFTQSDH